MIYNFGIKKQITGEMISFYNKYFCDIVYINAILLILMINQ